MIKKIRYLIKPYIKIIIIYVNYTAAIDIVR